MSSQLLTGTWRKRSACVRCRNSKVRCEYASPTDQKCVRCSKNNHNCVIVSRKDPHIPPEQSLNASSAPPKVNNHPGVDENITDTQKREQNAVYLQQIIRDAQRKLAALKVSNLRCTIASGRITWETAQLYYNEYREYPGSNQVVTMLDLPEKIEDLDEKWPWIAFSVVAIVQFNSANTSLEEYTWLHQTLQKHDEDNTVMGCLDKLVAYALLCRYALPFQERGLCAVMCLHGFAIVCMRRMHNMGWLVLKEFVKWLVSVSLLPLALFDEFGSMRHIYSFYYASDSMQAIEEMMQKYGAEVSQTDSLAHVRSRLTLLATSRPLISLLGIQDAGLCEIKVTSTVRGVANVIDAAFTSISDQRKNLVILNEQLKRSNPGLELMINQRENSELLLSPVRSSMFMMKLKLIKNAVIRVLDIMYDDMKQGAQKDPVAVDVLTSFINMGSDIGNKFARSFTYVDHTKGIVPTSSYYFVSEALLIMHMLRLASFAGGSSYPVRVDCLCSLILTKWEEFNKNSILARQFFFLMFRAVTVCNLKIGVIDESTNTVEGSGELEKFSVYSHCPRDSTYTKMHDLNRDELLQLIGTQAREIDDSDFGFSFNPLNKMTLEAAVYEHWSKRVN